MRTKPHQSFASSGQVTDAPTRTPAADDNLLSSSAHQGPTAAEEKTAAAHSLVEADRRPAGPLDDLNPFEIALRLMARAAVEQGERDFAAGTPMVEAMESFILMEPSPLEFAIYNKAYINCWLRSIGRDDLILDFSEGEGVN
jgi:hypothetical protein